MKPADFVPFACLAAFTFTLAGACGLQTGGVGLGPGNGGSMSATSAPSSSQTGPGSTTASTGGATALEGVHDHHQLVDQRHDQLVDQRHDQLVDQRHDQRHLVDQHQLVLLQRIEQQRVPRHVVQDGRRLRQRVLLQREGLLQHGVLGHELHVVPQERHRRPRRRHLRPGAGWSRPEPRVHGRRRQLQQCRRLCVRRWHEGRRGDGRRLRRSVRGQVRTGPAVRRQRGLSGPRRLRGRVLLHRYLHDGRVSHVRHPLRPRRVP